MPILGRKLHYDFLNRYRSIIIIMPLGSKNVWYDCSTACSLLLIALFVLLLIKSHRKGLAWETTSMNIKDSTVQYNH